MTLSRSLPLAVVAALVPCAACGDTSDEPRGSAGAGGGAADAGPLDAGADVGTDAPADAGPGTKQLDPCAKASCWAAPTLGACGQRSVSEDFGSGKYGVHHYLVMAPPGVQVELGAKRTAGSWTPTLIVHDEAGQTVFDGQSASPTATLEVAKAAPAADSIGVRVTASARAHLGVYLTGESVVQSGFSADMPTDAKYLLTVAVGCTPPAPLHVRGVKLDAEQELWVRYIATEVVPKVPGTASERVDKSAYVTWWSLKEGVLNVNNSLSYSNCSMPPDEHIGPVELCPNPKNAWQVGLSAVQVTWNSLAGVEPIAKAVYPGLSIEEVLRASAVTAGFGASTALAKTIDSSTDRLRLSWLLRNGPVGFEAQYPTVYGECFAQTKPWCFGSGWPSSASFAPSQAEAQKSVADLKAIFQALAP